MAWWDPVTHIIQGRFTATGQLWDYLSGGEVTQWEMDEIHRYQPTTKGVHNTYDLHFKFLFNKVHYLIQSTYTWWRHQMETFSALLAICTGNSPVPGEFPAKRPVTRSLDVFFDQRLNKRLSKQSWGWWFGTLSCPLWRHCNEMASKLVHGVRDHTKELLFCQSIIIYIKDTIYLSFVIPAWLILVKFFRPMNSADVEVCRMAPQLVSKSRLDWRQSITRPERSDQTTASDLQVGYIFDVVVRRY